MLETSSNTAKTYDAPEWLELGGEAERKAAREKLTLLKARLKALGSVVVAFSGGVDSTFLLKVAKDVLGPRAVALTATSPTYPEAEFREAEKLARDIGAEQIVVESNELEVKGFSENNPDRCYLCKSELFSIALDKARELDLKNVADGSNADDLGDYRPGGTAARELGVTSPLAEAGLTKKEIRILSRDLGLSTWNKPALACLSSRFPYGTSITGERLRKVGAAEDLLRGLGFTQFRVRYHGEVARIEVDPGSIERLLHAPTRAKVVSAIKALGFSYVTVDLEGYRTGSMNEVLDHASAD